ncbi:hypothetical protein KFE25_011677 [Diacronema lutheri]|uniref:HMG box domain-containing protein n=1 Tax=Diacronema lutheri TaxID=2081491 RepID=A0A8J5X4K3_DIALT|nr:hypothetical protein KFE25_011677 [Diacronema lutheri]
MSALADVSNVNLAQPAKAGKEASAEAADAAHERASAPAAAAPAPVADGDGVGASAAGRRAGRPSDVAGMRERKAVVRLEVAIPEASPLVIVPGRGWKLGEIENVAVRIGKLPSKSDVLKRLHSLVYGRPGAAAVLKRNLREFSGFDSDERVERMRAAAARCAAAQLREVLALCDLEVSGAKEALVERLGAWLREPVASGRRSLVAKAAEERRRAGKRKRAVERAVSRAEREKKAARTAGAQPPSIRATAAATAEPSGFDAYAEAKMARLIENNPSLPQAELLAHLRGKWNALDDDKRRPYEDEATAKAAEQAALRKCAQTAKAAHKAAKGGAAMSRKAQAQAMAAVQFEDLDDDDEEPQSKEEEECDSDAQSDD